MRSELSLQRTFTHVHAQRDTQLPSPASQPARWDEENGSSAEGRCPSRSLQCSEHQWWQQNTCTWFAQQEHQGWQWNTRVWFAQQTLQPRSASGLSAGSKWSATGKSHACIWNSATVTPMGSQGTILRKWHCGGRRQVSARKGWHSDTSETSLSLQHRTITANATTQEGTSLITSQYYPEYYYFNTPLGLHRTKHTDGSCSLSVNIGPWKNLFTTSSTKLCDDILLFSGRDKTCNISVPSIWLGSTTGYYSTTHSPEVSLLLRDSCNTSCSHLFSSWKIQKETSYK